jgi:thermitase
MGIGIAAGGSQASAGGSPTAPRIHGELLVKFKPGTGKAEIAQLNAAHGAAVIDVIPQLGVHRLRIPAGSDEGQVAAAYQHNPQVEYAEPNYVLNVLDTIPNDPFYASDQWDIQKVEAPAAWDLTIGSASVVVAVIDTGVSASHPDLTGKVIAGYDFANNDSDTTDDYAPSGHGTKVAGIIGAASNNGVGIAGIAWQSPILPVKVCDSTGQCSDANVASGIIYAVDQGAKVINISLGDPSPSSTLADAVNYAWNKGAVIVAAAGNTGGNPLLYPAAYPNVVAVGATSQDDPLFGSDQRASFSSYGPELDIVAPGINIYSTNYSGTYTSGSGTSFAAPQVAGAAALLWAMGASSNSAVVDALYQGALDINDISHYGSGPGRDDYYGWGRLDIYRSLLALGSASTPTPTPVLTLTPAPTPTPVLTLTPTPTPTSTPMPTLSPTPTATRTLGPLTQETFTGSVGTRRSQAPSDDHVITLAGRGNISAQLVWKGNGSLRLEIYDANNNMAAAATGASPESLGYTVPGPGQYTLRVIAAAGSGKYTLNVLHP